jgi:hypothetical protein
MFVRRSFTFTIGVMLCATLAAGAHAQTDQSGGGKTLVDLEAQAKAKKKAGSTQTTSPATGTTKTKRKTTAKKGTQTAPAKPADAAAAVPASTSQPGATQAVPASQPAGSAVAPAAPPDSNERKIYKSGDIPDSWKFEKEKAAGKKPVTEGAGAPAAAPPASSPPPATSTVATPASPASPAPAATARERPEMEPMQPYAPRPAASRRASRAAQGWRDIGYVSANFGWQSSSTTFTDARTLPLPTGDSELRQMTSSYNVKAGPMFDVGVGVRLVKSLGVAVSVTRFSVSNNITIDGTMPHPFLFNRLRPLSGTAPGTREELAVHVDGVWVVPGRKLQVAIFGGPTFFNAKQTVVNDYTYNDVYPFDAPPTFTAGVSAEQSKTATGFNAGADIGYFFTDIFGVGGVLRFSRGTLKSSIGDLDLGGPQFSAGVRIRLRQSTKPKAPKTPPSSRKN